MYHDAYAHSQDLYWHTLSLSLPGFLPSPPPLTPRYFTGTQQQLPCPAGFEAIGVVAAVATGSVHGIGVFVALN